jgi:hypothetical protein
MVLRYPTPKQLSLGCDRCIGYKHSTQNALCSATLGVPSPFETHGVIYNIQTGNKVGRLSLGPITRKAHTLKASATGTVTWGTNRFCRHPVLVARDMDVGISTTLDAGACVMDIGAFAIMDVFQKWGWILDPPGWD